MADYGGYVDGPVYPIEQEVRSSYRPDRRPSHKPEVRSSHRQEVTTRPKSEVKFSSDTYTNGRSRPLHLPKTPLAQIIVAGGKQFYTY